MEILKHAHSGLRWLVLAALILAILNAVGKTNGSKPFTDKDRKLGLFGLIFTHTQFLLGLILYFISSKVVFSGAAMKDSVLRFYLVEHLSIMVIAVVLITIGYSKSKRAQSDGKKFKSILVFYLIGLLLIIAGIPWPFRQLGAGWF